MILICKLLDGEGEVIDTVAFDIGNDEWTKAAPCIQEAMNDYMVDYCEYRAEPATNYIAAVTGYPNFPHIAVTNIDISCSCSECSCEHCKE